MHIRLRPKSVPLWVPPLCVVNVRPHWLLRSRSMTTVLSRTDQTGKRPARFPTVRTPSSRRNHSGQATTKRKQTTTTTTTKTQQTQQQTLRQQRQQQTTRRAFLGATPGFLGPPTHAARATTQRQPNAPHAHHGTQHRTAPQHSTRKHKHKKPRNQLTDSLLVLMRVGVGCICSLTGLPSCWLLLAVSVVVVASLHVRNILVS